MVPLSILMIGLDILRATKQKNSDSGDHDIRLFHHRGAGEAMNEGTFDFVPKPFDTKKLKRSIFAH